MHKLVRREEDEKGPGSILCYPDLSCNLKCRTLMQTHFSHSSLRKQRKLQPAHSHTRTHVHTYTHALTGACCRSGLFLPRACWEHLETPEWQHVRTALDKEVNCVLRGQCVDMQLIVLNCARGRNPRCPSTLSRKSMVRGT